MKRILTILLTALSLTACAQIQNAPPTGSKTYGQTTFIAPDGMLWYGTNPLKYRGVYPKTKVDSLLALIPVFDASLYYTKVASDARFYPLSTNPAGYLTSFTEVDPTVPAYAKSLTAFSVIKTSTDALYPTQTGGNASGTWNINILGNANTVTNGVYSTGSYDDPSWIDSLAYSKLTGAPDLSGYELLANKQNSLATDGTGVKYPTVDAVNNRSQFVTPEEFGAVGDGSTNDAPAIQAAINTGKGVFFANKFYFISTTLTVPFGTKLYSTGKAIILNTGNFNILEVTGSDVHINNIGLMGVVSNTNNSGIHIDGTSGVKTNIVLTNLFFQGFGKAAVYITNNKSSNFRPSIIADNLSASGCNTGYYFDENAEYSVFTNCSVGESTVGIFMNGGNNSYNGGMVTNNITGVILGGGANNAHSVMSGTMINHNTTAIFADSTTNGYLFNACMIYYGIVYLKNSDLIKFTSCDFSDNTVLAEGSTGDMISNKWITTPSFNLAYNSSQSNIRFLDNNFIQGGQPSDVYSSIKEKLVVPTLRSDGNIGINTDPTPALLTIKANSPDSNGGMKMLGFTYPSDVSYWNEKQLYQQYNGVDGYLFNAVGDSFFNGGKLSVSGAPTNPTDVVRLTDISGYELLSNKSTSTSLGTSNTLYPTQNAVKTYVDGLDVGNVKTTGTQTIAGTKTFNNAIKTNLGNGFHYDLQEGGVNKYGIGLSAGGGITGFTIYDYTNGYTVMSHADQIGVDPSTTSFEGVVTANGGRLASLNGVDGSIVLGTNSDKTSIKADNVTGDKTLQAPNASGTIALTSDLGNFVTTNTNQTISASKTFTTGQFMTDGSALQTYSGAVGSYPRGTYGSGLLSLRLDATSSASLSYTGLNFNYSTFTQQYKLPTTLAANGLISFPTGTGTIMVLTNDTPPSTSSSTGITGTVIISGGFRYECIATDSWVRSAVSTF